MTTNSQPGTLPAAVAEIDRKVDRLTAAAADGVAKAGYDAALAGLFVELLALPPDALAALAAGAVTRLAVQAPPAPRRPWWRRWW
jgi:hypothetical protein